MFFDRVEIFRSGKKRHSLNCGSFCSTETHHHLKEVIIVTRLQPLTITQPLTLTAARCVDIDFGEIPENDHAALDEAMRYVRDFLSLAGFLEEEGQYTFLFWTKDHADYPNERCILRLVQSSAGRAESAFECIHSLYEISMYLVQPS